MVWQIGSDEFHIPMYWLLEIKLLSVIGIFLTSKMLLGTNDNKHM